MQRATSLPLDKAVVRVVNDLLTSRQRYKLMSESNKATSIAKAIFATDFANGIAFEEIIKEAKRWLCKNVFTPVEILRQMDIRGGTLNYEGLSVLNDV